MKKELNGSSESISQRVVKPTNGDPESLSIIDDGMYITISSELNIEVLRMALKETLNYITPVDALELLKGKQSFQTLISKGATEKQLQKLVQPILKLYLPKFIHIIRSRTDATQLHFKFDPSSKLDDSIFFRFQVYDQCSKTNINFGVKQSVEIE